MQDQTHGNLPVENKTSDDAANVSKRLNELSRVRFEKQPPTNLRKSNFFSFVISIHDQDNQPIEIESGRFVEFIKQEDQTLNANGVRYMLWIVFSDGMRCEEIVDVHLVDSESKEIVNYEGRDKNPEKRRVLITHEVLCSRCLDNKSCGNRNETPSNPVIMRNGVKFFLKCNQNCLKNAGNPRQMRRFQILILKGTNIPVSILGYSEKMFVHNNSKHGRPRKNELDELGLEDSFQRLSKLIPRYFSDPPHLPKEVILQRAADRLQSISAPPRASQYFNPNDNIPKYAPASLLSPPSCPPSTPLDSPLPYEYESTLIVNGSTGTLPSMSTFNPVISAAATVTTDYPTMVSHSSFSSPFTIPTNPSCPPHYMHPSPTQGYPSMMSHSGFSSPFTIPTNPSCPPQYMHPSPTQGTVYLVDNNQNDVIMTSSSLAAFQRKRKLGD